MPFNFEHKPALVAYVTCGDPDMATTREIILSAANAGASVIELGVPFSDPLADGPVIQRASQRALLHGTTLADVIAMAKSLRGEIQAELLIFSYLNPIMRMGFAKFAEATKDAGIGGALITDLPVEEADAYLSEMRKRELATVFLAAPTSTDQRLKLVAKACTGFVYAVSRTGVTGGVKPSQSDAADLVRRLRKVTKLPIAVGFGISTHEQFAAVAEFADAAVVGSAIVEVIERNPGHEAQSAEKFVRNLLAKP